METSLAPAEIRFGIVRGISYGLFGKPDEFVPHSRALGAGLVRAYVYWGQIEPTPGVYDWTVVDALLAQLDTPGRTADPSVPASTSGGTDGSADRVDGTVRVEHSDDTEVWITVCSSSPWATRQPTDFLPPSPALDLAAYGRFVSALVTHCAGRVRYWQCDNEPSNTGLLWAGTAPEYVRQLQTMYTAVKQADPNAAVVLGGCGHDVLSSPEGSPAREFFDHLAREGRDAFDLFDLHLYDAPARIPAHIETARGLMRAHGYEKPVVIGEYRGPTILEFPEAEAALQETMTAAFAEVAAGTPVDYSTDELRAQAGQETPERRAMAALYAKMPDLPPRLVMFMAGCSAELDAKRRRLGCRDLVMRNLLALSSGVRRTACWNLAPEVSGPVDHLTMTHLLYATFPLLDYDDPSLGTRHPEADAFALMAQRLSGARSVTRRVVPGQPAVMAFEVDRGSRPPALVLWEERDAFFEEDAPPVLVEWTWSARTARAVDALGTPTTVETYDDFIRVPVSVTPVFVTAEEPLAVG